MRDTNEHYKQQQRLSFVEFLCELPNFIAVTLSAAVSGSLLVWLDFIDSLSNVTSAAFVALLARKLRNDLKYEYNYGIAKLEAISSLFCDAMLLCGLFLMLVFSVIELLSPKRPSDLLIYVVLLKIVNVAFDAVFVWQQYNIHKTKKTSVTESELYGDLGAFAFDAAALLALLVCWLFRNDPIAWYFSPVVSILLSVVFFCCAISRIRKSVSILTDKTLPEAQQLLIMNVLSRFYDRYEDFLAVNSHTNGDVVCIDLKLQFRDDMPFSEIVQFRDEIAAAIEEKIPNSRVELLIADPKNEG